MIRFRLRLCAIAVLIFVGSLSAVILLPRNTVSNYTSSLLQKVATRKLQTLSSSLFADTFPGRHLVHDLMQLSKVIYANEKNIDDLLSDIQFERVLWIEAEFSTEVMVVRSKEDQDLPPIVVFRGSEELDDWRVNTNIRLVKSNFESAPDSVKVHQGFQSAVFSENVMDKVEEKVLEAVGESGEVLVTGHSLGGANAHMCAAYLADRHRNMKVTMVNFGAPRFGNDNFKSWSENNLANLSTWRFVYRSDNVPRLIPTSLGYRHAGHLFAINRYGSEVYYRQRGGGEYEGAPKSWYFGTSIRHHKTTTYLSFFKNNMSNNKFWPNEFEKVPPPTECSPWWNPLCWLTT